MPTSSSTSAPPSPTADATDAPGVLSVSSILGERIGPPPTTSWIRVSDPGVPFTYEVPASWTSHAAYPWQLGDTTIGVVLAAGPDVSTLGADFSVPGVVVGMSANPGGRSPRDAVEAEPVPAGCTSGGVQDASDAGVTAAFDVREGCANGTGFLLVLAIVPLDGRGLIEIVFQGTSEADLAYVDRIIASIVATDLTVPATPSPALGEPVGGRFSISMTICQNQHGQGVSEGLIRNDDSLTHAYRIEVWFFDVNGVLLNTTDWTTGEIPPGVTARWQAMVPSGLPAVEVRCTLEKVDLVH